jgi:hypothetical protein
VRGAPWADGWARRHRRGAAHSEGGCSSPGQRDGVSGAVAALGHRPGVASIIHNLVLGKAVPVVVLVAAGVVEQAVVQVLLGLANVQVLVADVANACARDIKWWLL